VAATDGTLVRGVLDGDRAAFAELYDRRARLIRAICFDATHDLDSAAELTQEVFLRALDKLDRLRDPQRFAAWLVGIARQVCREWRRGRKRQRRCASTAPESLPARPGDDPPDERAELLRNALAALPKRERLSLQAFYLHEMDAEQACQATGLSRATLYRVLSSARTRLRGILSRQEVLS
jgi:RNA polymerase sigma-70 factor (ECF subfamily)